MPHRVIWAFRPVTSPFWTPLPLDGSLVASVPTPRSWCCSSRLIWMWSAYNCSRMRRRSHRRWRSMWVARLQWRGWSSHESGTSHSAPTSSRTGRHVSSRRSASNRILVTSWNWWCIRTTIIVTTCLGRWGWWHYVCTVRWRVWHLHQPNDLGSQILGRWSLRRKRSRG